MASTGARVLIVDDEPQIRRFLGIGLRAQGYAVVEASTARGALGRGGARRRRAAILDLGLPTWTASTRCGNSGPGRRYP
jgi:two-component system KDP operon response regulator KdpE